jgi:Icc-related predicted phosphoesterase
MYPRGGARAEALWSVVPSGLDVLVTHGPPRGRFDRTDDGVEAGCEVLAARLATMAVPPRLHVFGHIHEGGGGVDRDATVSLNASVIDAEYRLVRAPVVVEM